MSEEKVTIDNWQPPVRFYKGQKKTGLGAVAPWSGSTFQTDYEKQKNLSEYTGVFHTITKDCRENPLIPLTTGLNVNAENDQMDLITTNASTFANHSNQTRVKSNRRKDHTSTFINKEKAMKGYSTYTVSYPEKPEAYRPDPFRPGPPENIIAVGEFQQCPKSVNYETYRQYAQEELRLAKRDPIVLPPEFGFKVDSRDDTASPSDDEKHFSTSYIDDFKQHQKHERAIPLRPEENGIHYDLNSMCELSTTHDRAFKSYRFPAKRIVQRNEPVGGPYQPVSTMMSDFKFKTINNPAKPFLPPKGLRQTFGDEKGGYVTGYETAFDAPNLKQITRVKNCKPVHQYEPPTEKMECQSTALSHFTGKMTAPATSCKPNRSDGLQRDREDMNFKTEYNERFLGEKLKKLDSLVDTIVSTHSVN